MPRELISNVSKKARGSRRPLSPSSLPDNVGAESAPARSAIFPTAASSDAGTQTTIHDIHNHSVGPGYAPQQRRWVNKPFHENMSGQHRESFNPAGVEEYVLAPIPTKVTAGKASHACGNHGIPTLNGPSYYLPQKVRTGKEAMSSDALGRAKNIRQYYAGDVDRITAQGYQNLAAEDKRRVHPSITGIHLGDANSVFQIMQLLQDYPNTFDAIGEVTVYKETVDQQHTAYTPDFSSQAPIHAILEFAGRAGLPFILHCDSGDAATTIGEGVRSDARHFDSVCSLFEAHPKTRFVWAHMGGIGKYVPPGNDHPAKMRAVLEKYPNVWIDMSWDVVAMEFSPMSRPGFNRKAMEKFEPESDAERRSKLITETAAVIEDHPDRFIFGSDSLIAGKPESISDTYALYSNYGPSRQPGANGLFDYLSPSTLQKVLHVNFETVIDGKNPSSAIRTYEREQLQQDLDALQAQRDAAGLVPNIWSDEDF